MSLVYKTYFGFKRDPFPTDVPTKDLLKLPGMVGVKERLDYSLSIGGICVVTGEVGAGKSTSLRWAISHLHPSEVKVAAIEANTGSIVEIFKLISTALDLTPSTNSKAKLRTDARSAIVELSLAKKQRVVLVIDEAHLMRGDVLSELHTLSLFEHDSKSLVTTVLCGQTSLVDKLTFRSSAALASRVIAKTHLSTLPRAQLDDYLGHHLTIAGVRKSPFDQTALTAIYQGSNGLLRRINSLARGGLIAAATEKKDVVTAEHIRIAASELM